MTDLEVEQLLERHRREPHPGDAELIFNIHLETVERRQKLILALVPPAQHRGEFAIVKRRYWHLGGYELTYWITRLERIQAALTGEEQFDHVRFGSVLSDLRATQAEIVAVTRPLSNDL